jgi:hypothetical protein
VKACQRQILSAFIYEKCIYVAQAALTLLGSSDLAASAL